MLRAHEGELEAAGIVRLSLFGSTARGEAGAADVDLLATLDESRTLSLLDVIHLENQIADLLGERVDLLVNGALRPHVKANVDREAISAF